MPLGTPTYLGKHPLLGRRSVADRKLLIKALLRHGIFRATCHTALIWVPTGVQDVDLSSIDTLGLTILHISLNTSLKTSYIKVLPRLSWCGRRRSHWTSSNQTWSSNPLQQKHTFPKHTNLFKFRPTFDSDFLYVAHVTEWIANRTL